MNSVATVGGALADARACLEAAGVDTPALDARVLAADAFGMSAAELIRDERETVPAPALARLSRAVARRARGEPVAYITGRREFWSLEFTVGPGCLIPRPDSEAVVAAVLAEVGDCSNSFRILDLGTGSGCLLLALLSELPKARGIGVDADRRAVRTARQNAVRLGLADRSAFLQGNWAAALAGRFDLIVANPPYIPTADITGLPCDVLEFEPPAALDGGTDGLDAFRAVMAAAGRMLATGGLAALEFGPGQAPAVERLGCNMADLCTVSRITDLAGRDRGILFRRRENPMAGAPERRRKKGLESEAQEARLYSKGSLTSRDRALNVRR